MSEEISCPLCEVSESKPTIQENGYTGRQCASCGLIFVSPRPSQQEMAELYEAGEAHLAPEFFVTNSSTLVGRVSARHGVRILTRHVPAGSLLEIGPGNGALLAQARRRGFHVYGIELNPTQAEFIRAQRDIPCVTSPAEVGELGPKRFDVVYHRDVLSHFYDPLAEFEQIRGWLGSGGFHIFETGNFGDVDHRHFARVPAFQYPDHLFFYGQRSIHELLRRTGFEHVHTYRYSTQPEQLLRTLVRRVIGSSNSGSKPNNGADTPDNASASPERTHGTSPSTLGLAARDALDLTYWGIRHTVGAARIPTRAPQVLTVVARKVA